MALTQGLVLKQSQSLSMTPQMVQAVKLLQLSQLELERFLEEEVEKNPFISLVKSTGSFDFDLFNVIAKPLTLIEHLEAQLNPQLYDKNDKAIGAYLLASIDEAGYLTQSLDEMPFEKGDIEAILSLLQACTPLGVGARDLRECLLLQLKAKNHLDPMMMIFMDNLPLVAARDFKTLQKLTKATQEDVQDMMRELKSLNPKPGLLFDATPLQRAAPDILLTRLKTRDFKLELNSDVLPKLALNERYATSLSILKLKESEKLFIKEHVAQGYFLQKSLAQRCETLLRVAGEILVQQEAFFHDGNLKPMTLASVGEKLNLHESTISRAVSHKTILTPRGLFELKYFFTNALSGEVSATTLKKRVHSLIENEDKVLSDDDLVEILSGEGFKLARRTVAKYREGLGIGSSVQRRREKNFA